MSEPVVVSNSSALIAFDQIGRLELLQALFGQILIPPAVKAETEPTVVLPQWVIERPLSQPIPPRILNASLGAGESEAISLALETGAERIILDERTARRLAGALGLSVIGTLGLLLVAKEAGLLTAVRPALDALVGHGFRISTSLYEHLLARAGEQS
jgi:hypothetical protein